MTRLLVDAANVVGSRPDGWWRDRAGAAGRLVAALVAGRDRLAGVVGDGEGGEVEVIVVLEGAARPGAPEGPAGPGVLVVHAAGSGDDALVALAAPGDVVVTADRGLRERVLAAGARVVGPGALRERLAEG